MPHRQVYFFGGGRADGRGEMKNLLGGKGANLAEMTNLGVPVPAGFTISTKVCTYYMREDGAFPDALKGEVPCGFIVLKSGVNRPPGEIEKECVALIREKIGPVAAFKIAITVGRLPKTRSGKILRGTMKKIADGESWQMPATIDDPAILDEIGAALKRKGAEAA